MASSCSVDSSTRPVDGMFCTLHVPAQPALFAVSPTFKEQPALHRLPGHRARELTTRLRRHIDRLLHNFAEWSARAALPCAETSPAAPPCAALLVTDGGGVRCVAAAPALQPPSAAATPRAIPAPEPALPEVIRSMSIAGHPRMRGRTDFCLRSFVLHDRSASGCERCVRWQAACAVTLAAISNGSWRVMSVWQQAALSASF